MLRFYFEWECFFKKQLFFLRLRCGVIKNAIETCYLVSGGKSFHDEEILSDNHGLGLNGVQMSYAFSQLRQKNP